MSFAVIIECATLVAYLTVIYGGKQQRDKGWKVVCALLGLCVTVQCASMALVVSIHESPFENIQAVLMLGTFRPTSLIMTTVSSLAGD